MKATLRRRNQQGYVLVTMTVSAVALLGAVGMAVDMGRLFITKSETQSFCDAAAVAAALELDGTTAGITRAIAAAGNTGNTWNFNTNAVATPTVTFSILATGPWVASPNPATGYVYAKVQASAAPTVYFVPVILSSFGQTVGYTQTVNSYSIAGQVAITSFSKGLAPYTAVSTNTTGPNFGLVKGQEYDLQWPQYNSTRAHCDSNTPENCYQSPPCGTAAHGSTPADGDLGNPTVMWAVAQNWGANINGYWGFSSNSDIRDAILDVIQLQALNVGDNIDPVLSNGNKASEAVYLDDRASEDHETADDDSGAEATAVATYLASSVHNGRRLLAVPVVDPTSTTSTTVSGYASFLLHTNGTNASPNSNYYSHKTNGNDPFCAIYAGPYTFGSNDPGAASSGSGAYRVKLVE